MNRRKTSEGNSASSKDPGRGKKKKRKRKDKKKKRYFENTKKGKKAHQFK